ncbi:hypothetical protein K438DRAFT_1997254 [Mycena galopus ATCC 62051]|nr:hypothetical protein K438DRAFT_1997254 [Mycena galopus ATCC 62051]
MGATQAGGGNGRGEGVAAGCRRGGGDSVLVNAAVIKRRAYVRQPQTIFTRGGKSADATQTGSSTPSPKRHRFYPGPRNNVPAEDPTKSSSGSVIVFRPRNTPNETPVAASNGGVIVYGPRDTIPA